MPEGTPCLRAWVRACACACMNSHRWLLPMEKRVSEGQLGRSPPKFIRQNITSDGPSEGRIWPFYTHFICIQLTTAEKWQHSSVYKNIL